MSDGLFAPLFGGAERRERRRARALVTGKRHVLSNEVDAVTVTTQREGETRREGATVRTFEVEELDDVDLPGDVELRDRRRHRRSPTQSRKELRSRQREGAEDGPGERTNEEGRPGRRANERRRRLVEAGVVLPHGGEAVRLRSAVTDVDDALLRAELLVRLFEAAPTEPERGESNSDGRQIDDDAVRAETPDDEELQKEKQHPEASEQIPERRQDARGAMGPKAETRREEERKAGHSEERERNRPNPRHRDVPEAARADRAAARIQPAETRLDGGVVDEERRADEERKHRRRAQNEEPVNLPHDEATCSPEGASPYSRRRPTTLRHEQLMPRPRSLRGPLEELLRELSRPVHPRELSARLDVPWDEQDDFFELLGLLVEDRILEELPGGRLRLAEGGKQRFEEETKKPKDQGFDGKLSMHARGFGFVTGLGQEDVFIPPDAIYEAMHGDTVRVVVSRKTEKGLEGRVENVVKRRNPRIPGVLRRKGKSSWLEPDDTRIRAPITLTDSSGKGNDGDAAIVEITRFPAFAGELPEARVLEILGPEGDPKTEVRKILIREQIVEEHLPETLENAAAIVRELTPLSLGSRRDLRSVPLPTIDPEDARDHDDAVWVERRGKGYRVYVAIADVSEYVREGSPLDDEAKARGCTIYLPDRAIPMLPKELAADQCSLLPNVDRFCLAMIADLDQHGRTESFEVVEGLMRSAAKLTYGGVARALGFDPESPAQPDAERMRADLEVLAEVAEKLRKARMSRGALDLDLPEARVHVDRETGAPTDVSKRATRPGLKRAYSLIEELMLLANERVAEWMTTKKAPAIYRIHGKPDERKLEKLGIVAERLGVEFDPAALSDPLGVAEFLRRSKTHERHHVLEMLLLRTLKQAQYDVENSGHFGLASECYLHFTSPIRRYPDLTVHRQVKHILRGGKIDRSNAALEELTQAAQLASARERASMEIEREITDLYRALFMRKHIGDEFEGRVTGVTGSGLYVAIDHPFCDVMIRFEALGPDRYELSEDELSIVGQRSGDTVMLGDDLRLRIIDVAIFRRTVYGERILGEDERAAIERAEGGPARRDAGGPPKRGGRPGEGRPSRGRTSGEAPRPGEKPRKSFKDRKASDAKTGDRSKTATSRATSTKSPRAARPARKKR